MNDTLTTVNPLTRKHTTSARYIPAIGDRIAFNPGRRGMDRLYIGDVTSIYTHKKYGTIVDIWVGTDMCGSRLKGIAVDHLTVKLISRKNQVLA